MMGVLATLTACSVMHEDYPDWCDEPVAVSLALSVSQNSSSQTRSSADIIQEAGQEYRGLQSLHLIPFAKQGEIVSSDIPNLGTNITNEEIINGDASKFYFYKGSLGLGTASFLAYGRAATITGKEDKKYNGSLTTNLNETSLPANITFSPEVIYTSTDVPAVASGITDYLTAIANTTGWATTEDSQLKAYYLNFTGINYTGETSTLPAVIAGSSASVKAWVNKLKAVITAEPESTLRTDILSQIGEDFPASFPDDYPASLSLPDGAAAIQWDAEQKKFIPLTSTTMTASINGMNNLVYPAELYYYGNSEICTSGTEKDHSAFETKQWGANNTDNGSVLAYYENDPGIVNTLTRAVAIKKPVQYAVARLDATIKAESSTLKDAAGISIEASGERFPLTGILIGGQRQVGFNFKPSDTETTKYLVYDSNVPTYSSSSYGTAYLTNRESAAVHSILLQSKDGENETVILEFTNNSGKDFLGADGIVYQGTKFYLIGTITTPTVESGKDHTNRVFTQDYTTKARMTVKSLANAYNVVPNLQSSRLEIGVELITTWEQATPISIPLL